MDELIPVAENSVSLRSRYGMDELIPIAIRTLALDVLVISYSLIVIERNHQQMPIASLIPIAIGTLVVAFKMLSQVVFFTPES